MAPSDANIDIKRIIFNPLEDKTIGYIKLSVYWGRSEGEAIGWLKKLLSNTAAEW